METDTRIENYEKNLTDLECAIIEAQAFDRYKRYLKAAKEVDKLTNYLDKMFKESKLDEDEETKRYEDYENSISIIIKKYDLPRVGSEGVFGPDFWEIGCCCVVTSFENLSFQNFKQWITAAAYGRMTEYQYRYLVDNCEAFDYMDPYWIILGIPLYWTGEMNPDPTEEIGGPKVLEKMMHSLCTRNKNKARRLPDFGYTYKGQNGFVLNKIPRDEELALQFTKRMEHDFGITKPTSTK